MIETTAWPLPSPLQATGRHTLLQMTATDIVPVPTRADIVPLGDDDAAEMLALATLTRPGPFFNATQRLGGYVGIRSDGKLIAMAGTRLALPGFTEVSAVCTHPDHRGGGIAATLTRHFATGILAAGDVPFLTSFVDSFAAIAVYERLGFRARREPIFTTIERDGHPDRNRVDA